VAGHKIMRPIGKENNISIKYMNYINNYLKQRPIKLNLNKLNAINLNNISLTKLIFLIMKLRFNLQEICTLNMNWAKREKNILYFPKMDFLMFLSFCFDLSDKS
jgi:hypothetical protein